MQAIYVDGQEYFRDVVSELNSRNYRWADNTSAKVGAKSLMDSIPFYLHVNNDRGVIYWSGKLDDSVLFNSVYEVVYGIVLQ